MAFERADETRRVLVAHSMGDFLDAFVAVREQVGRAIQPLLRQQVAQAAPGFLLEEMLQTGMAEIEFLGQRLDRAGSSRLDHFQDSLQTLLVNRTRRFRRMDGCSVAALAGHADSGVGGGS